MLTTNLDISDRLINGQLGYTYDFATNIATVTKIYIKFDDNAASLKAIQNESLEYFITNNAVPFGRTEASFALSKTHTSTIKRSQFPIMLAYTCIMQKVQGLTLQKIGVLFGLNKQKTFGNGRFYVALTRVKNVNVLRKVKKSKIKVYQNALDEYERLRKEANFF